MPRTIDEKEAAWLPREKVLMICTGSQGENGAAMYRLANDEHPTLHLEKGDTVVFSSRIIPGNEKSIGRLHNRLVQMGVEVLTERDAFVHVSGHPARDELTRLYQWVRPKVAIPVHGELRHLNEHAKLARDIQVPEAIVAPNGTVVRLSPGPAEIIDHVFTGRLGLDGTRMIRLDNASLRPRKQMIFNGAASVTLVADAKGRLLASPRLTVHGFPEGEDLDQIRLEALEAVAKALSGKDIGTDDQARQLSSQAVRRVFKARLGKRPVTEVEIVRI